MPDANSQGNNSQNPGSGNSGNGEQGNQGDDQQSTTTTQTAQTGTVDLKTLPADQLSQVLENPGLFQLPRIKELLDAQRELKESKDKQSKAEDDNLKEQNKFKELSEKLQQTNEELQSKLEASTVNQALTNKLSPLGVVDLEGALALIDRSGIKIGENGTVTGVDEAVEALKTGKAYLFNSNGGQQPKVGNPTNPTGQQNDGVQTFKRSQLRDAKFYQENRAEILKAQAAGKIEDDVTGGANA